MIYHARTVWQAINSKFESRVVPSLSFSSSSSSSRLIISIVLLFVLGRCAHPACRTPSPSPPALVAAQSKLWINRRAGDIVRAQERITFYRALRWNINANYRRDAWWRRFIYGATWPTRSLFLVTNGHPLRRLARICSGFCGPTRYRTRHYIALSYNIFNMINWCIVCVYLLVRISAPERNRA